MNSIEILDKILIKYKTLCSKFANASNFLSNTKGDSYYSIQKRNQKNPVQIRLSNHGTFLKTWIDREELSDSKTRLLDPSSCFNISIVFIDDNTNITTQCVGQNNCDNCTITPCQPQTFQGQNELGKPFTVKQYVYKSSSINSRNLNGIVKAIMEARFRGEYIDPLLTTAKRASQKELTSQPQQPIQENNKQNTNKNIMKINESQLRKIIQESINGILNEITSTPGMGWMGLQFEEDDWTPVNEPNEGDVCYKIKLWSGSGYHLDAFKVYAEPNDYETALEILVAYFDRENINTYFVDDWVEEEMEDLREKGVSEDDLYEELSKSGDYYIDATMEGASKPHWLRGENLQMQAFPLKENKKNNKHCSSINEGGYSKLERDIDGKTLLDGAVIRRLRKMAEQIDYISSMSSYKMQDVCSDLLNVFWKHKIY